MSASQIVEGFSLTHAQVLDGGTPFLTALAVAASEAEDIYGVNDSSMDPDTGDYDNEGDDAVLSTWSWFNYADLTIQAGYLSLPLIANLTNRPVEQVVQAAGTPEVNSLIATGATAGNFQIRVNGQTTGNIPWNATAAVVSTALKALSNVDENDVVVTGGPLPTTAVVITWADALAGQDMDVTVQNGTLTGGNAVITTTTPGVDQSPAADTLDLWHEDSMNVAPKPMVVRMPAKDSTGDVRSLALGLYRVQFRPITFDGPSYKDGLKVNYGGRAVQSNTNELGAVHADGRKRVGKILSFV